MNEGEPEAEVPMRKNKVARGKRQLAVRVSDEAHAQVLEIAVLLSRGDVAASLNYGESTIAAAVRYIIQIGAPVAKERLLAKPSTAEPL